MIRGILIPIALAVVLVGCKTEPSAVTPTTNGTQSTSANAEKTEDEKKAAAAAQAEEERMKAAVGGQGDASK